MPPKRKRPPTSEPPTSAAKLSNTRTRISAGASRVPIKTDPETPIHSNIHHDQEMLREQFIALFSDAERHEVSNQALKAKFGKDYLKLVPIINDLTRESRLVMSKVRDELYYTLVSDEIASKFTGLDLTARMVYQVIEKAGNMGIWTKDIRTQTNIQQQALNKTFKVRHIDRASVMRCNAFLNTYRNCRFSRPIGLGNSTTHQTS
jgi:RNA polymerase Rpc34 subunit